jgi:hypothetical protein
MYAFINANTAYVNAQFSPHTAHLSPHTAHLSPHTAHLTFLSLINKGFQRPELIELIEQEGATRFLE